MKRIFILLILSVVVAGCGAKKAPIVRISQMCIESQKANYDLAMHIKGYLYGTLAIGPIGREYINNIGAESVEGQKASINQLFNYRVGDSDVHALEYELRTLSRKNMELHSTIKAFLLSQELKK